MRAQVLRAYHWLHTWTGIVAGLALFVAFVGGALTMFQDPISRWERPQARHVQPSIADVDRLTSAVLAAHPVAASRLGIMWPTAAMPDPTAFWFEGRRWHYVALSRRTANGSGASALVSHDTPRLAAFLDRLHYALALPPFGRYLMGAVSIAFGFALVSGLIVHLPRLTKDLFALRPGKNRKRFWQDAHNALGLFALPFYAMIAITGAFMCLTTVIVFVFNVAFGHELSAALPAMRSPVAQAAAPSREEASHAAPLRAGQLLDAARRRVPDLDPKWITFVGYGKPDGFVEVWGDVPNALGTQGAIALRLNTGAVMGNQTPGARDANHAIGSAIYGLHFGTYGGLTLRWIYFVLGLCGAAMVLTGNLMWLEARRKRDTSMQPRAARNVARATVGVCVGTCVGIAAAFVGALCWPEVGAARSFGAALAVCLGYSTLRTPIFAARDLLAVASLMSASIAIADALLTGDGLAFSIARHDWALAAIDLAALAAAILFACCARVAHRRAVHGAATGVWAGRWA
ncbi:PepSY-associated TM helix domain-containing protein [Trinickia dinghuensis]|nr:PepSY-associated TM helix domain-containing protein [Trinickia dinghuensis]